MSHQAVLRRLEDVARRVRQLRLAVQLAAVWLASAGVAGAALWLARAENRSLASWLPAIAVAALAAALLFGWRAWRSAGDMRALARRVELAYPDLDATLLTAIEQRPAGDGRYGFLQEGVLRQAFFHSYKNRWTEIVPTRRLVLAYAANAASAGVLVAALAALAAFAPPPVATADETTAFESVAIPRIYEAEIEPGNAEVERGSSLLVLARFKGELPPEATIVYEFDRAGDASGSAGGATAAEADQRHVAMTKSLDDPVFGGRIPAIARPLAYRVVFAERASPAYRVTVFDHPELVRADVRLTFPAYTGMDEKLVQDVRRVSAVEGTQLTLSCVLNKPVATAELVEVARSGDEETAAPIALEPVEGQANTYAATMTLDRSRRLELRLVDADGRTNRSKAEFIVNVLPNRPADLKLIAPAKDVEASPIEELDVRASAWDDFGLSRVGISYAIAGKPPIDVVLGEGLPGKQHTPLDHTISFESLTAEPDELLSYYFWAEDMDAEGKPRRTASDMFFVEVRHFEEIFRQGQQPTDSELAERQRQQQQQQQQGGENARQAEQLAELQKQIISGTWKIIRRETSLPPSEAFAADVELLVESQNSACEQAEALGERVEDERSQAHLDAVIDEMAKAAAHLTTAKDGPSLEALATALAAEQAAYQGLLKLRAREHEVIRAQRQQQSSQQQQQNQSARNNPSSRAQQQLQELELREDENRYETERTALPQETAEQREDRQVLNRLRELSRRQEGLNERIQELQSALEAAETPQEREEIERQLKRLRDEQQQIVRDAEELQERMERPENQQRMSDERQQLEQARENARQSSEALQEGQVTQAAAEGERAERQLNELRDQFQERTGGQFNERVRQMREAARELDERERSIAERLEQLDEQQATAPRLSDGGEREQIGEQLTEQQERLGELLEQMRQTVEEAETAQPLLAEKLYDSIRESRRQDPARALDSARQSLDRGLVDDARSEERRAGEGISRLREDVDRAAESVLGSDVETLERALERLRSLSEDVADELQRETGEGVPQGAERATRSQNQRRQDERPQDERREEEREGEQQRDGQDQQQGERQSRQPGEGQQGERQDREAQDGDRQPGERQPGDRQPGERQNGEAEQGEPQQGEQQQAEQQQGEGRQGERQQGGGQRGSRQPNGEPREDEPREDEPREDEPRDGQPGEGQPRDDVSRQPDRQGQPQERGGQPDRGQPSGQRRGDDRTLSGGGGLNERREPFDRGDDRPVRRSAAPIGGDDFLDWSDRLRDVEEMIADAELRAEAARIREEAQDIRKEVKRHSAPPNWDLVRERVAEPLVELQRRVTEELLRRTAGEALVPIDRDPVPEVFEELVRRYYEELGTGE